MSRKYSAQDRALFHQVFLQFAWIPPAHLAALMRVLSEAGAVSPKWADLHQATVSRWISDGRWREQVDALSCLPADDGQPLPTDDAIDDLVMRRNLQMFDRLTAQVMGGIGDPHHTLRHYLALQAEIRSHVQTRQAIPLTPTQLIELFVRAGYYAAGQAFDSTRAKEFLIQAFSRARQLAPAGGVAP